MQERRKLVYIQDTDISAAQIFNVVQVIPYFSPDHATHSFIITTAENFRHYSSPIQREDIIMTEVLSLNEPQDHMKEASEAKPSEIQNLLSRGTCKISLKEGIRLNGNILPGHYVLALKTTVVGTVKHKARFVICGHRGKLKKFMVPSLQTL